ncbi:MAG: glycosyltransferase family 10 [Bacteroidales bacterium]|nr:glycosyltransferase family 10 [Bacteroidales bacterium]
MITANIYFAHWLRQDILQFPVQVDIYNVHADRPKNPYVVNVLNISNEPENTRMSNKKVVELAPYFDLILTWDENILKVVDNGKMFLCGMTWIRESDISKVENKKFKVSTFCTSKNMTANHYMRQKLWNRQKEITEVPIEFWNSSHNPMANIFDNPELGPEPHEKIVMFDSMFHIAIENSCYNNYFTEKLMDCFQTKTIPIYVGAPNIDKFFNIKGMFIVEDVKHIIGLCNCLTENDYYRKLKYAEENYVLSQEYCRDFSERVYEAIMEHLDGKV